MVAVAARLLFQPGRLFGRQGNQYIFSSEATYVCAGKVGLVGKVKRFRRSYVVMEHDNHPSSTKPALLPPPTTPSAKNPDPPVLKTILDNHERTVRQGD